MGCLRDLVYGATEGQFVRFGRLGEAAEFADELQRRRADFFVRRRRFEVVQGLDVSTHYIIYPLMFELIITSQRNNPGIQWRYRLYGRFSFTLRFEDRELIAPSVRAG